MVKIRMKPGCGRMLIGRQYKLIDGSVVPHRPRSRDDIVDTLDEFLEQGEVRELPLEALAAMLNKDGKPTRVIEGYPLTKMKGAETEVDDQGNPLPRKIVTEDTWTPGRVRYDGNVLIASHPDCPFEIVNDSRAA